MTTSGLLTDSTLEYGDHTKEVDMGEAKTANGVLLHSTNTAAETVTERSAAAAAVAAQQPMLANLEECILCTRQALRGGLPLGKKGMSLGDPLAELIFSIHENNEVGLEQDEIDYLVKKAQKRVTDFKEDLRNRTPELRQMMQINQKSMALFDLEEIRLGAILGRGGFSNVFEITCFSGKDEAQGFTPPQTAARKFVTDHAQKTQTFDNSSRSHTAYSANNHNMTTTNDNNDAGEKRDYFRSSTKRRKAITMARYALKHLRPTVNKDRKKFVSAAVDLVLEAQFLLTMEHPHIIKIRGFAREGPEGFRTGKHNGYFIIVDQLPEILEERMWSWRQIHRSLTRPGFLSRLCCGAPSGGSASKAPGVEMSLADLRYNQLMEDRLHVAFEITSALEYIHKRGIIYRDIKPTNIGFDIRGDVKIFDFGLARFIPNPGSSHASLSSLHGNVKSTDKSSLDPATEDLADEPAIDVLSPDSAEFGEHDKATQEAVFRMSSVGTPYYMAPEVRLKQPYNTKADVFSMGVVLWEMLALSNPEIHQVPKKKGEESTSKPPLPSPGIEILSSSSRYRDFQLFPICPCWPPAIRELVSAALSEDYRQRPTADEMKQILGLQIGMVAGSDMDENSARRRSTYLLTDIPIAGHSWALSASSQAGTSSMFRSGDSFSLSRAFSATESVTSNSGGASGSGSGLGPAGRRTSYSRSSFSRNSFSRSSGGGPSGGSSGSIGLPTSRKSFSSSRYIKGQGGLTAPLIEELSNDLENSAEDFASAEQIQQQHAEGMARTTAAASSEAPIQEDKDDVGPME